MVRRLSLTLCAALIGTLVPVLAPPPAGAGGTVAGPPLVVRFAAGAGPAARAAALAARGLTVVDELPGSDHVLVQPDGAVRAASTTGGAIDEVAPVVTHRALGVPDDPAYPAQWHLPAVDAVSAWDVTTGTGTVVAVLDTGVASRTHGTHVQAPDLAGTSFTAGWDFVSGDPDPDDEHGHGTHVAGVIAQTTGNGIGGAGVAPGASIMPVRVLDGSGTGTDWNVAQGLRFAADHGADVINLSLGSPTASSVVSDAVHYAVGKGVTVVAASGNDGAPTVSYPAALDAVIAVGAVRLDLTRPAYGSYGKALDLVAPGGDLSVDQDGNGYGDGILQQTLADSPGAFCFCFMQGTSAAAPQVSATAALVASRGVTDPAVIRSVLESTATDLGPGGRDDVYGHGLVSAGAAARAVLPAASTDGGAPAVRGIEHACPSGTTPEAPFRDVAGSVHAPSVSCATWWDVTGGVTPETFEPGRAVTRGQLASFVARLLEASGVVLPTEPPDAFPDDDGTVHEPRIDQLAALDVVNGRRDGTYAPAATVSRAEMATILVRAHDVVAAAPLEPGPDRFADDDGSVHEGSIDAVAAAGLAAGTGSTTFAPADAVLRGQMATFLSRTLDLFVATGAVAAR